LLALKNAKFPEYDEVNGVDYDKKTDKGLPLSDEEPLPITVVKIGDNIIIDPLGNEEKAMDARVTMTTTKDGNFCSMQKGGMMTLSTEDLKNMAELTLEKVKELRKHVG
ncbi:RNA-binding protein, partial [Nanoarchaeota archaeon]